MFREPFLNKPGHNPDHAIEGLKNLRKHFGHPEMTEEEEDSYRKRFHHDCFDCEESRLANKMGLEKLPPLHELLKSIDDTLTNIGAARLSGICRNCSTLRDIDGNCGCNN